jgi:hypothetical protein
VAAAGLPWWLPSSEVPPAVKGSPGPCMTWGTAECCWAVLRLAGADEAE